MDPMVKSWLNSAPSTPFMDIEITDEKITLGITAENKNLLQFLRDEYGIEYEDPTLVLCG